MSCNHLNDCSRCGGTVDYLEEIVESLEAKVNRLSKGFSNHSFDVMTEDFDDLSDEEKESAFKGFADGTHRVLIVKPKIGAWGLNWQHCNHVVTFASHSFEQYYQSIRRCWRFGQKSPVVVDVIASEGEVRVKENMARKSAQADKMFAELVFHMNNAVKHEAKRDLLKVTAPSFI